MMKQFVFLFTAILFEVLGTSMLKASQQFTKLQPSVVAVLAYVCAFYFLSLTLKTLPVGIAYAIWSGAGVVLISLVGWILFKQTLDWPSLLGMALIVVGVFIINVFSKSVLH